MNKNIKKHNNPNKLKNSIPKKINSTPKKMNRFDIKKNVENKNYNYPTRVFKALLILIPYLDND